MKKKIKTPALLKGQIKNKKLRGILKFILSLFILYHLAMVFIMPQYMSMIHERLIPYFISYAHTLSFTTSWDFYAPNPTYYYYFQYEVVNSKNKVGTFRWPPSRKESKRIYLNHNRLIYHARFFMLLGHKNIRKHFMPYLCYLHPEATEITLQVMFEDRPHFKKAKIAGPRVFSADNAQKDMKEWMKVSSKCKKRKKSRNINTLDEDLIDDSDVLDEE